MAVRPIDGNVLIEWFRPYLHTGEAIPADVVIEDIRSMPTLTPPNEWVCVEERLPEQENTQVLMTDGECHYISSRNNMVRFLDCEGIFIPGKAGAGVKVTHWMPLPAPPERRPPEGEEGDADRG